jgi:hypothetical protein
MDIQAGDRVLVNVAPFIGSARRSKDSVPCQVIETGAGRMRVRTEPPYREVELWIQSAWIDGRLEQVELLGEPSLA